MTTGLPLECEGGDLCRATIYDDPADVAPAMLAWFDGNDEMISDAATWFRQVSLLLRADLLKRHHPERLPS